MLLLFSFVRCVQGENVVTVYVTMSIFINGTVALLLVFAFWCVSEMIVPCYSVREMALLSFSSLSLFPR